MSNTYTYIEDEAEAGSESEGEPTLSKHLNKVWNYYSAVFF